MFYSLKKNYKVLLIASCIFLVLGIYQHKKANEIDLTKLTDLQQICEVLNLPIGVVCPDGATEHDFSAEIHQGRGLYTVAFQPYKHTKADYETWVIELKEASRQISIGEKLLKAYSSKGTYYCSTTWYITQQNGPEANVIVSWSDGDSEDGIGMLKLVFEMY